MTPSLHAASKSVIQPAATVGTAASKDSSDTYGKGFKGLQHLFISRWRKAGFSYRLPVGTGPENTSAAQLLWGWGREREE